MKSIFVTGAASGIGKATSLLFAKRGFKVGCYDVDVDGARKVAEEIGSGTSYGRIDVANAESWNTAVEDFASAAGRMDVLFNCAGILRMGRFEDVSPEDCRKQLDVNVMGVILGIHRCLPLLERTAREPADDGAAGSVIVNMSSASAVYGQPELAVYSATKFAVRALTEALDVELRAKGIRVVDVMPGYVDTPMVHSQTHTARTLDRLGIKLTADDVAEVVWKAAHGRGLHYVPQTNVALLGRIGGLIPELGRAVMHRLATR
jgi:NAD(P)-dependent dehydrogenase (short-subunit alcohol dehydrogenase family)